MKFYLVALGAIAVSLTCLLIGRFGPVRELMQVAWVGLVILLFAGIGLARGVGRRLKELPRPQFWSESQRRATVNAGRVVVVGAIVQLSGIAAAAIIAQHDVNVFVSLALLLAGFCIMLFAQVLLLEQLA